MLVIYPVFSQSPPKYQIANFGQESQIRNQGFQSFSFLNVVLLYWEVPFHD